MLVFRSIKIFLVILILILPYKSFAQNQMKFACMSSWYEHCYMGICEDNINKKPFLKQVKIFIDLDSMTLIRSTDNNYVMKIIETRFRPEKNIYIGYEDNFSNGYVVINILQAEETAGYVDTLFTNSGGFVSTGFCKSQILDKDSIEG